jgi:hypothetical protein
MPLFRLFAYAVSPQRTTADDRFVPPTGGPIDASAQLRATLDGALSNAHSERGMTPVTMQVDPAPDVRSSPVRDAVMGLAFERFSTEAERQAFELAVRLSRAMDHRSPACLFLAATYRNSSAAPGREVALWIFPQDDAFRLQSQARTIELLTDVFSKSSRLRKLALFNGRKLRTDFLEASVLDFQAGGPGGVAEFWIERFLEASLTVTPEVGTRMLADAFRQAATSDLSFEQREQLQAAIMAVRSQPGRRLSLQQVATQFLAPAVAKPFLASAPNEESARSLFRPNRELLDRTLNFRVFELKSGVWVSAPLGQIGDSVLLEPTPGERAEGAPGEHLRVEGDVVQDKLASRRA